MPLPATTVRPRSGAIFTTMWLSGSAAQMLPLASTGRNVIRPSGASAAWMVVRGKIQSAPASVVMMPCARTREGKEAAVSTKSRANRVPAPERSFSSPYITHKVAFGQTEICYT